MEAICLCVGLGHDLHVEGPLRVLAAFDRLVEVASVRLALLGDDDRWLSADTAVMAAGSRFLSLDRE
jgi:hypothetical protein